jgi:MoxR-like ATPase
VERPVYGLPFTVHVVHMTMSSIEQIQSSFGQRGYVADRELATAVFLSLALERPLLLEGEAGVGKTEVARTLAQVLDAELIRLQCYEGLDLNTAVYEWDYPRQMLEIRLLEARGEAKTAATRDIFSEEFLIRRPLLQALQNNGAVPPVLLIDEVDRADEEFEAFLLELLSDFAVSIPEIGTLRAKRPPRVILTSNRTREVHDALKRRCLYHWIDYPSPERELAILHTRLPGVADELAREIVGFVQRLRTADLTKSPGVAETLDWAAALTALEAKRLEPAQVEETLGVLLKYQEDVAAMRAGAARTILEETRVGR